MVKCSSLLTLEIGHATEENTTGHDCKFVCYIRWTASSLLFHKVLYSLVRLAQSKLKVLIEDVLMQR